MIEVIGNLNIIFKRSVSKSALLFYTAIKQKGLLQIICRRTNFQIKMMTKEIKEIKTAVKKKKARAQ